MKKINKNAEADLDLIERIKGRDNIEKERAFKTLFNKYHDSILFHYKGIAEDRLAAEELVMDAFIKISTNLHKFDKKTGAFSTWLFNVAKNIFIDDFRKRKMDFHYIEDLGSRSDDGSDVAFEAPCLDKNVEEMIIIDSDNQRIRAAVEKIDNCAIKEFIELRFFAGMTYDEIAEFTDRPLGSVKNGIKRGKEFLKTELSKHKTI